MPRKEFKGEELVQLTIDFIARTSKIYKIVVSFFIFIISILK